MNGPHSKVNKAGRHSTFTLSAAYVAQILRSAGFRPHAGPISGKAGKGGNIRLSVLIEESRIKIGVSGNGHQDVLVYGEVNQQLFTSILESKFGKNLIIRDPHGLWKKEEECQEEVSYSGGFR